MFDILPQYNIRMNRSMMVSCPFHKDRHPSMKIYKDGFKCFTCGKAGDIFRFIQEYENCSFKDAFLILGGTYETTSDNKRSLIKQKFERQKSERIKREQTQEQFKKELLAAMRTLELVQKYYPTETDTWCYAVNNLPFLKCAWEEKYIEGREVNEINVYRKCREVRRKFNS